MPVPLPALVLVELVRGSGYVGRPFTALAPRLPLSRALQLEGACVQQRLLERQELLVFGSNCSGAQPVPVPLPPLVLVDVVWAGRNVGRPFTALAQSLPLLYAFQIE